MKKISLHLIVLFLLAVSGFSQPRTFDNPTFPFEVRSRRDKPYHQLNIILAQEHFSRENLIQLFSYLGRNASTLPIRVAVFSDKTALEKELLRAYSDSSLASTPTWDRRMRSLSILEEERSISYRAYYYKDGQAERFNYDFKHPVRFIEVTFHDGRKFENTSEFLLSSIKGGYTNAVRWLLKQERKFDLDSVDSTRSTPLSWALWLHHNEIVEMLISAGVDVNGPSAAGTPLFTAIGARNLEGARAIIKSGTNVNQSISEGVTPLIAAALNCDYQMIKLLLENGAKTKVKDAKGRTASSYCDSKDVKDLFAAYDPSDIS